MFRFKILIKSKSEITGLKNKYCCVPPFIHFLIDRGRNVHTSVFTEMNNIFRLNTKIKNSKLKKSWDGFFFLFFFYNEWYSPLSRNKLFIFSHHGYLSESEESLSFYMNAVLHHSLFSLSITIGSRAEICCPVPMPIMTKYCEDKHWHPIITRHNVTGLAMIGGIALT